VSSRRWTFIGLLAAATFINYLDRGSLAVALPFISKDLGLGPIEQGFALSAFFWTYAAMQIPVGWLVDRCNIKRVYAAAFTLWSLSAAATGLVRGLGDLVLCRIVLGIGESIYLPGGMKVVSLHFRAEESAWPAGVFDLGAKLGLAIGTAVDVWLLVRFGWRSLFFRTGLVGLLWLIPWLWLYPSDRPRPTDVANPASLASSANPVDWPALLTHPTLAGISIGFFCWDYFWYFVISWLPSYLYSVRGVALPRLALFGALPFLIFAVAEAIGGWGAASLVRRGGDLSRVTKGFIAAGFAFGLLVIPAALVESSALSIGFLLAASLSGIACGNMLAIPKIGAPEDQVGLWTGVQNCVGNIGGVLAPIVTGYLIARTGSYVSAFFLVAAILVVGAASYLFVVPRLSGDRSTPAER
jgi:ACS family D-galactonate transporter-like MFS transporter